MDYVWYYLGYEVNEQIKAEPKQMVYRYEMLKQIRKSNIKLKPIVKTQKKKKKKSKKYIIVLDKNKST